MKAVAVVPGKRQVQLIEQEPPRLAAPTQVRLRMLEVGYEATGASSNAFQVMEVIGTNGVFVFTGVPGRKAPIEVDTDVIMRSLVLKNQVVFGTVNAGHEAFEAAIRDLTLFQQRWPAAVCSLITGRYPGGVPRSAARPGARDQERPHLRIAARGGRRRRIALWTSSVALTEWTTHRNAAT